MFRCGYDLSKLRLWAGLLVLAIQAGCLTPEDPAHSLHFESIVVDGHSDTTPRFEDPSWDFGDRHSLSDGDMDLPRIREGGLDVQFWSIYMGERDIPGSAIREALERIDAVYAMAARNPEDVVVAASVREIRDAVAAGKFVSLMGIEGGHIIEDKLSALRTFFRLGVRYMTLTHSFHTNWADSSGTNEVPEPLHRGLTPFGEEVVLEMNRLGMMVDISHVSDETFWDALRVTSAPIIASHSSCRAVADHPRNMSDAMLRALAANGGVVMINFYSSYIDVDLNKATRAYYERWQERFAELRERFGGAMLEQWRARRRHYAEHPLPQAELSVLLDHFDHAIAVAGPGHVGIGADWDGVASFPRGLEDITGLPRLTLGLLQRGHSDETVRKVLGENMLRVMREAEKVARDWRD